MKNMDVLHKIKGGLIVSCQALKTEPLYGSDMMAKMAVAVRDGGAVAIRSNSPQDIKAIKKAVSLPVIGLYKVEYPDSEVYITPTMREIDTLIEAAPDIIAMDATNRLRPESATLENFFYEVRKKYPDMLFMADCSCFEDAVKAEKLGFDVVGTTLCGYTEETKHIVIPDYDLLHRMTRELNIPIIAEGGIWNTEQLKRVFEEEILAAVVGTAITRPREITRHFISAIHKEQ